MSDENPPPRRKPSSEDRSSGGNGAASRPAGQQSRDAPKRSASPDREPAARRPERAPERAAERKPDRSERQEPDRKEPERKEPQRQESERKEPQRQESERKEPERQESERKEPEREEPEREEPERKEPEKRKLSPAKAARAALEQFTELSDYDPEGVVGIEPADGGGWKVLLEVVESRRIPDTTDIMGEYQLVVDGEGDLVSYSRRSRYARGRVRDD